MYTVMVMYMLHQQQGRGSSQKPTWAQRKGPSGNQNREMGRKDRRS